MKYLLHGQKTERLLFRKIDPSDFKDWSKFYQDPKTSLYWVSEDRLPGIKCENWYKKQEYRYDNDKGGMNALIEKSSGMLIGHSGLLVQTVDDKTELEIAYSILPEFWNQGYATEAAIKCKNFAFKNDFANSLVSITSLANISSEKVAIKNGIRVTKTTFYNDNKVNIFRINRTEWKNQVD